MQAVPDPASQGQPKYRRILLKISGEALLGKRSYGIDFDVVRQIASQIKTVHELGVGVGVVIGGGNIFRGIAASKRGFDRATGDYMGMLGTVINALALQEALEECGVPTRTMTAITMPQVAEQWIRRRAVRHLEKGRVILLAAGTGNPYFTTDTTAALRAAEIEADVMLKGTHGGVDGVYTADPKSDPGARKLDTVSFADVLTKELRVMDLTAITLCKENGLPICVFDLMTTGNIRRALAGEPIGTLVN